MCVAPAPVRNGSFDLRGDEGKRVSVPYWYAAPGQRVKPISVMVGLILGGTALLTIVGLAEAGPGVWKGLTNPSFQSHAEVGSGP